MEVQVPKKGIKEAMAEMPPKNLKQMPMKMDKGKKGKGKVATPKNC